MATFERHVEVQWKGGLMDGTGDAKAGTGAFTLPVTFPSRIQDPAGRTSPEELMAAAHASCYAMALNATLGRKQASAERTVVTAKVSAELNNGITITSGSPGHGRAVVLLAHGCSGDIWRVDYRVPKEARPEPTIDDYAARLAAGLRTAGVHHGLLVPHCGTLVGLFFGDELPDRKSTRLNSSHRT